ncbi:hypothetical protein SPRG_11290 [Saprolegnia parasitica CBS 223.65]|uniref:Nucleotide-diphospho-sugar transferase domain-containing protein n=1 Tax=Saprolegnia parasitica (strain CBS 223.65) TaxID=695850 RepID=A0A067BZA6_SAPPC|nr:hypothetical protein SPRG_11290 [Saprolegnia parasitica CBS 223.65]KDO23859.1 hypothetical protein SPRG_11290 [Saprolegnia parasitica CBS 223.65]|eukprot:XP_012205491.1 hypothetical protein SPRG_11290 [Saprolegnia parasitica CBS 223.65]
MHALHRLVARTAVRRLPSLVSVLLVPFLLLLCIAPFFFVQLLAGERSASHLLRSSSRAVLNVPTYSPSTFQVQSTSTGAGIVIPLHNNMAALGVSLILELRRLNTTLPIQIYHCFSGELVDETQALLRATDPLGRVEIVDACALLLANGVFSSHWVALEYQSYLIKVLALLHTSFDQVMLMDADVIFLESPDTLWAMPGYSRTGTLFFYDRRINVPAFFNTPMVQPKGHGAKKTLLHHLYQHFPYAAFGLRQPRISNQLRASSAWQGATAHEQDSSIVLIHKARVAPVVWQVLWHLVHHLRFERAYKPGLSWGDKEYFWLAFALAGAPYAFSPFAAANVALPEDMLLHNDTLCGNLAHYIPSETETDATRLFYINGNDVLSPYWRESKMYAVAPNAPWDAKEAFLIARIPSYVTPRRTQRNQEAHRAGLNEACLVGQGARHVTDPRFRPHVVQRIKDTIAAARIVHTKPPNNWDAVAARQGRPRA